MLDPRQAIPSVREGWSMAPALQRASALDFFAPHINLMRPSKALPKIILILWFIVGVAVWLRPLVGKQAQGRELLQLWNATLDERHSIVYGREYFEFLQFCQKQLPAGATFLMIGPEERSLDYYRATYFLYPLLRSQNPDYLLIYKAAVPPQAQIMASFSSDCFIINNPGARQP